MKIHIFVFEDYGIATFQEGFDEENNTKISEIMKKKSKANYVLDIKVDDTLQRMSVKKQ